MKKLFTLLLVITLVMSTFIGCSYFKKGATGNMNSTSNTEDTKDTVLPSQVEKNATSIGDFRARDLKGNEVTKDVFSNYDLTLVNLFTTWCTPCVKEIPDLNAVKNEMANKSVNVIGIPLDVNEGGQIDQNKLDKLNQIIAATKAEYQILLPDEVLRSGRLKGVSSVPESFFVDKNGNIVGNPIVGSNSKEEWIKLINDELAKLK